MFEYKQCPNGHYYQGDSCPYCVGTANEFGANGASKAEGSCNQDSQQAVETIIVGDNSGAKTTIVQGGSSAGGSSSTPTSPSMSGRTVFGDDDELARISTPEGVKEQRVYRDARKLVGWLVSYTIDPLGVDFKLYEGRNILGRDMDCNITVNDPMVSAKHAVLLFRSGKYSITDSQSSHGTFVNDEDIELEPRYLQDGDVIRIGHTLFKLRTSL